MNHPARQLLIFPFVAVTMLSGLLHGGNPGKPESRKGITYFYWGWNRSFFSPSDIRFSGNTYDFTLYNVIATDRKSDFEFRTHLHPKRITIPQFNFRIGYYLNDTWEISFGMDHMKYVMKQFQTTKISGFIFENASIYQGTFQDSMILLSPNFLMYEHTDGLNYENLSLRKTNRLFSFHNMNFETVLGAELGILLPRTNTTLMNQNRYDEFHLSGYGISVITGLRASLYRKFFVQFE
jgi:hypothetical protein